MNRGKEPVHGYWIEGQSDPWLAVRDAPSWADATGSRWSRESKLTQPWPDEGDAARRGVIQRFAGGFVLTHSNEAGGRTVLLFVENGAVYRCTVP